jgi:hypothetical protein
VPVGSVITATATDPADNTSEFSACLTVLPSPPLPLLTLSRATGDQVSLTWTNTATGFVLKETDNSSPPIQWATVTNTPVDSAGQLVVTLDRQPGNRFYLLSFE